MPFMQDFDLDGVLSAGGWDPRYAVTLAAASSGDVAAALVDTNGDGVDVDLDIYERDPDGSWQAGSSGRVGESGGFLSDRTAVICGRTEPDSIVDIEYAAGSYSVVASSAGWWLFVTTAAPPLDTFPRLIRTRPATRD